MVSLRHSIYVQQSDGKPHKWKQIPAVHIVIPTQKMTMPGFWQGYI